MKLTKLELSGVAESHPVGRVRHDKSRGTFTVHAQRVLFLESNQVGDASAPGVVRRRSNGGSAAVVSVDRRHGIRAFPGDGFCVNTIPLRGTVSGPLHEPEASVFSRCNAGGHQRRLDGDRSRSAERVNER